jgi:hypothetical protein
LPSASGRNPANAPAGPQSPGNAAASVSLNDRLKHLDLGGDVDYRPKRVALGDAQGILDAAVSAYDQRLAPPPEILRRTFGFIYERRTSGQPDSLAYVYDSYTIGPIRMCKAWKIVEHPYVPVREVGAVARNSGIGGAVVTADNSPVVRHGEDGGAEIQTVQFPCTERSYTAVPLGSITTPLPRHPDLVKAPASALETPPASPRTPAPSASLAP